MKKIFEQVMLPKTGLAVEVKQGQHLRVTDLEGKQVVDMVVFNLDNVREKLSPSYSRTRYFVEPGRYFPHDRLKEGDYLMSTLCRPMMTIFKETPEPKGVHDAMHRTCNRFFYKVFAGVDRDGCHEIIGNALAPYGLLLEDIPDNLNIFMNYPYNCEEHHFEILEPITKPGDYIEFRAEMNCLVGFSNCPEDIVTLCNGGRCTPVKIEVYHDDNYKPKPVLPPDKWLEEEMHRRKLK